MRKFAGILIGVFLVILVIPNIAYADDGDKHDSDTVIDVGISGDVEVDIDVSGPSELNVGVEGPSDVNIDAGEEVDVNVQASDESRVSIQGEHINQPAGDQETGDNDPSGDLNNESLNLQEHMSRWNPYVAVITVAFPVLGLLTLIIVGLL